MKTMIMKLAGCVASLALVVTALNVNTTCMFIMHQPELPEGASRLRRHNA